MKKVKTYKVELFGGPMNGAIRYYDSLSTAKRVARSYVTRNRDYPENVGFWISEVYEDSTTKRIIYKQTTNKGYMICILKNYNFTTFK